jgi:hypothetical protein
MKGSLKFTLQEGGYYTFEGVGTLQPLLGGIVRKVASPSGLTRLYLTGPLAA